MPQGFVSLAALLLLIGGSIWFFTKGPPAPPREFPRCDDAAQIETLRTLLAEPANVIVHETREAEILRSMSLTAVTEVPQAPEAERRLCDATLEIAANKQHRVNAYGVGYDISWGEDENPAVSVGDIRRTKLPPCSAAASFFTDAMSVSTGGMGSGDLVFSEMREISFDFAAQIRRCTGMMRRAELPNAEPRPFSGTVSWADRAAGRLMVEMQFR